MPKPNKTNKEIRENITTKRQKILNLRNVPIDLVMTLSAFGRIVARIDASAKSHSKYDILRAAQRFGSPVSDLNKIA
jgi:hypothetical protein